MATQMIQTKYPGLCHFCNIMRAKDKIFGPLTDFWINRPGYFFSPNDFGPELSRIAFNKDASILLHTFMRKSGRAFRGMFEMIEHLRRYNIEFNSEFQSVDSSLYFYRGDRVGHYQVWRNSFLSDDFHSMSSIGSMSGMTWRIV